MTAPPNGGRGPSQRTAIESIEEATVEARTGGHTLGGFVRRCNSAGYGFFARCRVCRIEVAVHRSAAGWNHSLEALGCEGVVVPPDVEKFRAGSTSGLRSSSLG
jgi:hypothetical protein